MGDVVQTGDWNQSQEWSTNLTASTGFIQSSTQGFDGDTSTYLNSSDNDVIITLTPPGGLSYKSSVRVWLRTSDHQARINGGAWVPSTGNPTEGAWTTIATGSGILLILLKFNSLLSLKLQLMLLRWHGLILVDKSVSNPDAVSITGIDGTVPSITVDGGSWYGAGWNW